MSRPVRYDHDAEQRLLAMRSAGLTLEEIAVQAKCSRQNIQQIFARIDRRNRLPRCEKLTAEQRSADRARLREVLGMKIIVDAVRE